MGRYLGQDLNIRAIEEKTCANKCFLCQEREETIDHLLLHRAKTSTLGVSLLSFWCFLGHFLFGARHPFGLEGLSLLRIEGRLGQ